MFKDKSAAARTLTDKDMHNFCQYIRFKISKDAKIIEIGSYIGTNALLMLNYFDEIYCVDAWVSGYDDKDKASHQDMKWVEAEFDKNVKDKPIVKHKSLSVEAADEYEDEYFDMVYIDATHTYDGVKSDLEAWLPKVKKGGIIAGHDYETKNAGWDNGGLKKAVEEIVGIPDKLFGTNWLVIKND